jgi:predicted nucleotidyltransferase
MKRILKKITNRLSKIDDVRVVVLYGSFARGENTSRSDIDVLILTTNRTTQEKIQDQIIELENEIGRRIQPTIRTISELQKTDTGLLQNIFQEGKILYLREPTEVPSTLLLRQKPFLIYTFKITGLDQKEKARFNRQLYPRNRKGYSYKGFLQEINGRKLAAGCIIVPFSQQDKIEKFFKKYKVTFTQLKVWR